MVVCTRNGEVGLAGKIPRKANTYRGARRNAARGTVWPGVKAKKPMFPVRTYQNKRDRTGQPVKAADTHALAAAEMKRAKRGLRLSRIHAAESSA